MLHKIEDVLVLVTKINDALQQAKETDDDVQKHLLVDDASYLTKLLNNELNGE